MAYVCEHSNASQEGKWDIHAGLTSPGSRVSVMFEHMVVRRLFVFVSKRKPWPSQATRKASEAKHFLWGTNLVSFRISITIQATVHVCCLIVPT